MKAGGNCVFLLIPFRHMMGANGLRGGQKTTKNITGIRQHCLQRIDGDSRVNNPNKFLLLHFAVRSVIE